MITLILLVLTILFIIWAILRISKTKPNGNVHNQSTEFFREHREDSNSFKHYNNSMY